MADLVLERLLPLPPERLFELVSTEAGLLQWWGPEGFTVPDRNLDFTRTGPWHSVMHSPEGTRHEVSGQVTHVDPPQSLGFTWAWHDAETGDRGAESHVTFTVTQAPGGAKLVLAHRDLPSQEAAESHESGWSSALRKLEQTAAEAETQA